MAGTSIDARTVNRNYPKPFHTNGTKFDGPRLTALADALDVDVATVMAALLLKANIDSPVFTGAPEAPSPNQGDDSNRLATTSFVVDAIAAIDTGGDTDGLAPIDSPVFTGTPTTPSVTAGDNSLKIANTAFVTAAINAVIGAAPGALDTLAELAAALGNNANFATTVTNSLAGKADIADVNPVSTVIMVPLTAAPTGYLKCNGAAVSRTTYADLFAKIGTTFGTGNGSTTFNVPDLRGEFIRGLDDGRGVDTSRTLATAQASQNLSHTHTNTVTSDSHTHTGTAVSAGAHVHTITPTLRAASGGSISAGSATTGSAQSDALSAASAGAHTHTLSISTDSHTHTVTIAANGGTEARPRNQALLFCIKF